MRPMVSFVSARSSARYSARLSSRPALRAQVMKPAVVTQPSGECRW